ELSIVALGKAVAAPREQVLTAVVIRDTKSHFGFARGWARTPPPHVVQDRLALLRNLVALVAIVQVPLEPTSQRELYGVTKRALTAAIPPADNGEPRR